MGAQCTLTTGRRTYAADITRRAAHTLNLLSRYVGKHTTCELAQEPDAIA